eukprot:84031-Amphidinium_carterae.1
MERIYAGDADQSRPHEASEARSYRAAFHRFTSYDAAEDPELGKGCHEENWQLALGRTYMV